MAADIELIAVSGTGMESPIINPADGKAFLLKNTGGALPQEDGTVLTGGVLDEPVFQPRPVSLLWQPGPQGGPGTLQTIVIENEPTPVSVPDSIVKSASPYHYSTSSGFLIYSFAAKTNSLDQTTVIWNKPDLGSPLSPIYQSGDAAPGIPGATLRYPSPSLLTANSEGNYAFTASLDGTPASQSFAAWAVLDGISVLVHQNDNPAFGAGVLGFSAPVIGAQSVLFNGNVRIATTSYPGLVKWENNAQQLITYQYGTLTLGDSEEVYTRQFGGKAIDGFGRVLFQHQTNTVQESLVREDQTGRFHRLVSKDDVLDGDATIISFKDNGSSLTRPLLSPDGRAVFLARFRRPGDTFDQVGIWRETKNGSGQFDLIVDGSDAGHLIDYGRFQNVPQGAFDVDDPFVSPDGRVVFKASFGNANTLNTNDTETAGFKALFAEDSARQMHMLARTGQAIMHTNDVKIITDLFLGGGSQDSLGRVGFYASLVTADPYGAFGTVAYIAQLPGEYVVNTPPAMDPISDKKVFEKTTLAFSVVATDADVPSQQLTFSLGGGAPMGTTIDPATGNFSWTPTETQGPGVYLIKAIVSDDGSPPKRASQSFFVTVLEVVDEGEDPPVDPVPDFGDAPDSAEFPRYPTLFSNNGAYHLLTIPNFHLGPRIDFEGFSQPDAAALGDDEDDGVEPVADSEPDDEDGVTFLSALTPGKTGTIDVFAAIPESIAGDAKLDAWIDFNQDFDWADPGEQVLTNAVLADGSNLLELTIPADAALGLTYARFRLSKQGGLTPAGPADDGEVEDYQIAIVPVGPGFDAIGFENDDIVIRWSDDATLESAPTVLGPWQTVDGAASPYTVIQGGDNLRFYRLLGN